MKYLITGTGSGLGKYLHRELGGVALKHDDELSSLSQNAYDVIIHCGHPRANDMTAQLMQNSLMFTERLLGEPHQRFIYISTVDVYPLGVACREDADLPAEAARNLYATSKLRAESLVRQHATAPLILRASAMLGAGVENSLVRMLYYPEPKLPTADSTFNYILHEDLLALIRAAIQQGAEGTYNAASSSNIALGAVAARYGKKPAFGSFRYQTGTINNAKAQQLCSAFARSSEDNIERYIVLRGERV